MVSPLVMQAAINLSKAIEAHHQLVAGMSKGERAEKRTSLNQDFLKMYRPLRVELERCIRADIRMQAIKILKEGEPPDEIAAAIARSDARDEARRQKGIAFNKTPTRIAKEKARSERRAAEREERKKERMRERWGGIMHAEAAVNKTP